MTLNLGSPWLSRLSHPPHLSKLPDAFPKSNLALLSLLLAASSAFRSSACSSSRVIKARTSLSEDNTVLSDEEELLTRVSAAKDANEALQIIAEFFNTSSGVVSVCDCSAIITAALDRSNADLALSVFYAMRSSFDPGPFWEGCKMSNLYDSCCCCAAPAWNSDCILFQVPLPV